jgi:hypothetical protein
VARARKPGVPGALVRPGPAASPSARYVLPGVSSNHRRPRRASSGVLRGANSEASGALESSVWPKISRETWSAFRRRDPEGGGLAQPGGHHRRAVTDRGAQIRVAADGPEQGEHILWNFRMSGCQEARAPVPARAEATEEPGRRVAAARQPLAEREVDAIGAQLDPVPLEPLDEPRGGLDRQERHEGLGALAQQVGLLDEPERQHRVEQGVRRVRFEEPQGQLPRGPGVAGHGAGNPRIVVRGEARQARRRGGRVGCFAEGAGREITRGRGRHPGQPGPRGAGGGGSGAGRG